MEWAKFKYEQKKKKKDSRQKGAEMKEIWFSPFISDGDINHKIKKIREFIQKKHPVKLTVRAKGRSTPRQLEEVFYRVVKEMESEVEIMEQPKREGRNFTGIVHYLKDKDKKKEDDKK